MRPDDFDAFWDDILNEVAQIPLNASMSRVSLRSTPEVDLYEVRYDSLDGVRIAGWYCLPTHRPEKLPAILHVPGYIGEPGLPKPTAKLGYAIFSAAPRGKLRSNAQFNPGYPGLLTHNIVDRNTYGYRGFYIDAVRAFDFLQSRPEVDPQRIGVSGSSQGGGLTLVVSALRSQVRAAAAGVPYLCAFMDAIELTHTYPYQEIRDYLRLYPEREPAVRQTLAYFDGVHFGPRITCPIIVNVGLQDNVCPPETGYAAFKTIASADKKFYPYDGHGHDGGSVSHNAIVEAFFKAHLNPQREV
jgi:cephalosporin-C deacetylase